MLDPEATKRETDSDSAIRFMRIFLHTWPFLVGFGFLASHVNHFKSTEVILLVDYGLPDWALGVALLSGGAILIAGRFMYSRPLLAAGDFTVGTVCITMALLMADAALKGQASWGSVGLWLVGYLFELQCVYRARR